MRDDRSDLRAIHSGAHNSAISNPPKKTSFSLDLRSVLHRLSQQEIVNVVSISRRDSTGT
jgi:hypothetical protein